MQILGRLEKVSPRDIWANEATVFTPWLASEENLVLLGETLGMELELEAQEKGVGPYRADIVCRDTADASWVLIENQLEATDHIHLGQVITYAAGLNAVTIVWIAVRFTEEHRAALDWLNEISSEDVRFFGLEVELWRIGESPPAPKFNVVAKPNEWTKAGGRSTAVRSGELSEAKQLQRDFWHGFNEYVQNLDRPTVIKPTKALPQHWMNIAIGRTGFKLNAIASLYDPDLGFGAHEIRAEFEVNDRDYAKVYFAEFEADRDAIEAEIGEQLTWHNPETANACRVYIRRSVDLNDLSQREDFYGWLLDKLETLHRTFSPRVRALHPPAEQKI